MLRYFTERVAKNCRWKEIGDLFLRNLIWKHCILCVDGIDGIGSIKVFLVVTEKVVSIKDHRRAGNMNKQSMYSTQKQMFRGLYNANYF